MQFNKLNAKLSQLQEFRLKGEIQIENITIGSQLNLLKIFQIDGIEIDSLYKIFKFTSLERIEIDHLSFQNLNLSEYEIQKNINLLKELTIRYSNIENIFFGEFNDQSSLKKISLSNNIIKSFDLN